jgi:hypothetical protein
MNAFDVGLEWMGLLIRFDPMIWFTFTQLGIRLVIDSLHKKGEEAIRRRR